MLVIGLTGGIGCGKTTITDIFKSLGAPVIDADEIAHQLVEPNKPALIKIVNSFGAEILNKDQTLNRSTLRELIYADSTKKQTLEDILHPLIYKEMYHQLSKHNFPYGILSIPLLLETQHHNKVDRILVIDCDEKEQINRVIKRDGLTKLEVQQIMRAQCSRSERLLQADDIIENNRDITSLNGQVEQLHTHYLNQ